MILVVLASFTCALHPNDLEYVLLDSGLLSILQEVFTQQRNTILGPSSESLNSEARISVVKDLHEICHREISRSILQAAVTVTHIGAYQIVDGIKEGKSQKKVCSDYLEVVLGELSMIFPLWGGLEKQRVGT